MPIILYNVPSRTACDLLPETVVRLAAISNIIGIKEATGELKRLKALLKGVDGRLDIYSGDDPTGAEWMLHGAKGVISVTANVAPTLMAKLTDAALDKDKKTTKNCKLSCYRCTKLYLLSQTRFQQNGRLSRWA